MRSTSSRRRASLVALASAAGLVAGVGALAPTVSSASSHREAPYISTQPQLDNTDVYAFTSPDDESRVTFVANWIPFEEPNGGRPSTRSPPPRGTTSTSTATATPSPTSPTGGPSRPR